MERTPEQVERCVHGYVDAVLEGELVVGRLTRLAVERYVRDVNEGSDRGLWFDEQAAARAINFFSFCKHSKGEWAGQPLDLEPWQQFVMWNVFGWKNENNVRRFRTVYDQIARKNGKSTKLAGVGLLLTGADDEEGAEVYTAATKLDQAKIIHEEAKRMVKRSKPLSQLFQIRHNNIHIERSFSKYEPLGADSNTLDGLNVHAALIDELHAHKTRTLWDVLDSATGARSQPMMFAITTAGFDRNGICYEMRDYSIKVLEETIEDDTMFAFIAEMDEGDDWRDEANWIKANPNLNVSVYLDDLRRKAKTAAEIPSAENNFRCKHCNEWVEQEFRWMPMHLWAECADPVIEKDLIGRPCYGGLDLANKKDIAAWVLLFPPHGTDEKWRILPRLYVPADNAIQREQSSSAKYHTWGRQGYLKLTPGNVIDYATIRQDIIEDGRKFGIQDIGADRWNLEMLRQELDGVGAKFYEFGQGFRDMSEPMKELDAMVAAKRIAHGNHPVLRWMASNVVAKSDEADNIKPDKKKSAEKIDGIVALIMAIGRAKCHEQKSPSVYETRGILTL